MSRLPPAPPRETAPPLLPCPFCGAAPSMSAWDMGKFYVRCDACNLSMSVSSSPALAAARWNRRVPGEA